MESLAGRMRKNNSSQHDFSFSEAGHIILTTPHPFSYDNPFLLTIPRSFFTILHSFFYHSPFLFWVTKRMIQCSRTDINSPTRHFAGKTTCLPTLHPSLSHTASIFVPLSTNPQILPMALLLHIRFGGVGGGGYILNGSANVISFRAVAFPIGS